MAAGERVMTTTTTSIAKGIVWTEEVFIVRANVNPVNGRRSATPLRWPNTRSTDASMKEVSSQGFMGEPELCCYAPQGLTDKAYFLSLPLSPGL